MLDPVATTGLLVAAIRGDETRRPDPLFRDPYADHLAGDIGRATLATYRAATGLATPVIELRTRYYDDAIARAQTAGIQQFVLLAAGMDARAYRLAWPPATHLYEVDRPAVLAHKAALLADTAPTCTRTAVPIDLADDWPAALVAAGFDPTIKTCWLVEGLLQYLEQPFIATLFARLAALAAPGSRVLYDVIGRVLLDAPFMAAATSMMRDLGAPWRFGTDDPAALVTPHGFTAAVQDIAGLGLRLGRWPMPFAPGPGGPRGYLVEATLDAAAHSSASRSI